MNVLIIPSWYPNSVQPLAGIFIKEQAEALGALCPDLKVIVSTWGFDEADVPLREPGRALRALLRRITRKRDQIVTCNGVWEIFNPHLNWSERLVKGGLERLVDVNRRNYRLAEKKIGKVDVVHAHVSYPAGHVARVLAAEHGVPYVLTEHMGPFPLLGLQDGAGRPRREIVEAFTHAAQSVAVSPFLASRIASYGLPRPMTIPNLVDERRFVPGPSASSKFVFFTLCSIVEAKGIEQLIRAVAKWNPPAAEFEFRIGGEGPMRGTYEQLARHLGVDDRIRWLGGVSREQAPALFRDCHVYVMPSHHETFGVVYAEAIASGKPVIATRCGGPESIVNDLNGRLVEVGDVAGLAATLQWMAENWSQFEPRAIREDFEKRFSRAAVTGQLLSLYRSVTGRGSDGGTVQKDREF